MTFLFPDVYKSMLYFQSAHPQTNASQPAEHDADDGGHDEIRFGREGWDATNEQFGDDEEPDQEEIEAVEFKDDSPHFQVRLHGDDET